MAPEARPSGIAVVSVAAALGLLLGAGLFTFAYAEGDSYLSDDPAACINCHVMQEHHDAWLKSSHSAVAVCNTCHAPHDNVLAKYWSKAVNGFNHSWAFTTGRFPDHILITDANREVAEAACRECHTRITDAIDSSHGDAEQLECTRCHASVGHGP